MTFVFDPYGELGTNTYSDAEKLRLLADWFDHKDDVAGVPADQREVQADLRRIADELEVS